MLLRAPLNISLGDHINDGLISPMAAVVGRTCLVMLATPSSLKRDASLNESRRLRGNALKPPRSLEHAWTRPLPGQPALARCRPAQRSCMSEIRFSKSGD